MANEILNEAEADRNLDKALGKFTISESWAVNKVAIEPYYEELKKLYSQHRTYRNYKKEWKQMPEDKRPKKPERHLADTLVINKEHDGSYATGFSRIGKKAYIGRFINDGWDVKNQYGGPYRHVEGKHYFEQAEVDTKDAVQAAWLEKVREVRKNRGI